MSAPPTPHRETAPRLIGIVVFAVGLAALAYVFLSANALYHEPPTPLPTPRPSGSPAPDMSQAATAIGQGLADYAKRLLALLLMCVAGSLVASLGLRWFFGAKAR